jgi:hypothetical protein
MKAKYSTFHKERNKEGRDKAERGGREKKEVGLNSWREGGEK